MENINEINSYNSLSMSPSKKKEIRVSTSYRTTKRNIGNELNEAIRKNEINSYKRVSIELNNSHPQKIDYKNDKTFSNIQDISSTKEEDSSNCTISKFPKIQKHLTSISLNNVKDSNQFYNKSNNNYANNNNLSNSNILNQKDSIILNNNSTTNSNNTIYHLSNYQKNNNKSNRIHNIN